MDTKSISNLLVNRTNDEFKIDNKKVTGINFKEVFNEAINKVNDAQVNADEMDRLLAAGETDNVHEVMIASQKAELTLNLAIEVKTKIMEAYKEIMRLQI